MYIILAIIIILCGYFAFRYFTIISAVLEINRELQDIQKDLTQNQMLHLPVPNRHLGDLVCSINLFLGAVRKEQQSCERHEKELKKQIENISHDLRTPLTVILGYLKLYKDSEGEYPASWPGTDTEWARSLEIIEKKAESMKKLVTQFYDLSRLNADDYKLTLDRTDIGRILRETLIGNYQLLESVHLDVDADLPGHPVWGICDPAALERIFSNLLQNAGRYGKSFLKIRLRAEHGGAVVSFINDTELLSQKDIPYLFQRFYRQDDSRNQEGTGLGLTLAQALAEEMGGSLEAELAEDENMEADSQRKIVRFTLKIG